MMWTMALLVGVQGHGYIEHPRARGIGGTWATAVHPYHTEPQSAGATGAPNPIPVCGRDGSNGAKNAGTMSHRFYGANDPRNDPITTMQLGEDFQFQAHITAHHMGHMTVRICPFIDENFSPADLASCYVVQGAANNSAPDVGPFWFLTTGGGDKYWTGKIPDLVDLPTSSNNIWTVHWRWSTANSCNPWPEMYKCAGVDSSICYSTCAEELGSTCGLTLTDSTTLYGGSTCSETTCCSEVFTNCADVVFGNNPNAHGDPPLSGGSPAQDGTSADPVPQPEPEPETTAPADDPTPQPEPETTNAPAPQPATPNAPVPSPASSCGAGLTCAHNTDCDESAWCNQASVYVDWCAGHITDACPSPQCKCASSDSLVQVHKHTTKFARPIQVQSKRHATIDETGHIGFDKE